MDGTLESFGRRNFGAVDLGDRRRTERLVTLVDTMCRHPGGTLPDKFNHPPDLRAFYGLMNRAEVTHAVLLRSHADATRQQIAAVGQGVVLRLHDATELDYTTKTTLLDQLGQIGQGTNRGYICHNSLAVRADTGETLGLVSQILHHRADVPVGETDKQKRERLDRESRLWVRGAAASGAAPAGVMCVDVSDSLSDTFEYLAYEVTHGRPFVLRARENRRLEEPVAGQKYLFDAARQLPSLHQRQIQVLASPTRKGRTATVQVAFAAVRLAPPGKKLGEYDHRPLDLWVLRVWERDTPAGEEPLEWILLTNVAVAAVPDAEERIAWYERRPIIEELHKGMKTGCAIELMQFEKIERLEPAIAVLSAVATTLLRLRDAARAPDADTRPATEVVAAEYVEVLADHYGRRLGACPSVLKFYMHVARLGGHQNRKGDGLPGWITLWRGWMKLQSMVDGYRAARKKFGTQSGKT
jgi:Transposase DNA-binding